MFEIASVLNTKSSKLRAGKLLLDVCVRKGCVLMYVPQVLLPSDYHKHDWRPRSFAQCAESENTTADKIKHAAYSVACCPLRAFGLR